jgi:hypothetical protein
MEKESINSEERELDLIYPEIARLLRELHSLQIKTEEALSAQYPGIKIRIAAHGVSLLAQLPVRGRRMLAARIDGRRYLVHSEAAYDWGAPLARVRLNYSLF